MASVLAHRADRRPKGGLLGCSAHVLDDAVLELRNVFNDFLDRLIDLVGDTFAEFLELFLVTLASLFAVLHELLKLLVEVRLKLLELGLHA